MRPYAALAPVYDALLGRRFFPRLRRVLEHVLDRHGIRFASAADVGCGTGTLQRWLCGRGAAAVYGVDPSPAMLREAMANNRCGGARFLLQDFASLRLPEPVDLITCTFDALNYLLGAEALLGALRRFRANLNPGGYVVFDLVTGVPPASGGGGLVERASVPAARLVRVTRWDPRTRLQTAHVWLSSDGQRYHEVHLQRGWPVAPTLCLLVRAGLTPVGVYDFDTLGPATARTRRAVFVARYLLRFPVSAKMGAGRGGAHGVDSGRRRR